MNASVAIVIFGNENNNSLSWTTFPPVLLADELSASDTDGKCNNFGHVATKGTTHGSCCSYVLYYYYYYY